jgi:hypothetical protein
LPILLVFQLDILIAPIDATTRCYAVNSASLLVLIVIIKALTCNQGMWPDMCLCAQYPPPFGF